MKKLFLLVLTCCVMIGFGSVSLAKADTLALSLALDGSGSISSHDWTLQLEAYADAIKSVVPTDGSVAINVIQFSTSAQEEIGFTVIDSEDSAVNFAYQLLAIHQIGGSTDIAGGIDLAAHLLSGLSGYDRLVIDVSTDGDQTVSGKIPAVSAFNAVYGSGIDAVNAIGVGTSAVLGFKCGINSFSVSADNWNDFADALENKLVREITNSTVPEPATAALFGIGLLGLAGMNRRKK